MPSPSASTASTPVVSPGTLQALDVAGAGNVLSVDLESWHGGRCEEETLFLLDLFRRSGARATFFVLGSLARREPALVRRVAAEGHEIACHGWDHVQIFTKSPATFREDLRRSIDTLSGITGTRVLGYRAAHFSITEQTYWAFDVLAELGFAYDSSIFPIAGRRYGVATFPRGPVRVARNGAAIVEVPLSTVRHLGLNLPVAGGGYFRLLPYPLIKRAVLEVSRDRLPFVMYCHPYEFGLERLSWPRGVGFAGRARSAGLTFKWNLFRAGMRPKLERVLGEFRFGAFQDVLGHHLDG